MTRAFSDIPTGTNNHVRRHASRPACSASAPRLCGYGAHQPVRFDLLFEVWRSHIEYLKRYTLIPTESAQGGRRLQNGDALRSGHGMPRLSPATTLIHCSRRTHSPPHGSYSYYFFIPGPRYISEVGTRARPTTSIPLRSRTRPAPTSCTATSLYHEMLKSGELSTLPCHVSSSRPRSPSRVATRRPTRRASFSCTPQHLLHFPVTRSRWRLHLLFAVNVRVY